MSDRSDIPGRSFLGRWSERKQAARETVVEEARKARGGAAPALPEEAPEPALPELYNGDEREMTEEERATVAALPDIDSLHADSDFTAFMLSNVPEFVRRRALKALWRLNPILANVDGLVDYGEDYTDATRVIEGMQTAYKVGRGFLTDEDLGIEPEKEEDAGEAADDTLQAEAESSDAELEECASSDVPDENAHDESEDEVGDGDLV
ncbi:MAG: DUF3306 domain-containing protein [Nisaea sp.]|uniref:DUF3306 domain-containing protein n=1 Tax=Nisaea sp. TaxID=2024842 RepID=UPI001B252F33|nr:DUF3306 domain-containing protein [Nisaea sp.]MBO6562184.1 DUF3306 domain-containing protein [Nisaea sp.]